jgi:hypothetical protein
MSGYNSATNRVLFYNREFSSDIGYLDDVVIQTVPEPGAFGLLLFSASVFACRRSRQRRE